jgi:hypothetical protein
MKTRQALFFGIAAALACALVLAGCPQSGGGSGEEVDFSSHNTDYSILVRNNTGKDLVAFKGSLKTDTLIGGIPAHATDHGLPMDPKLFDRTQDFPMIILTNEQYESYKDDLRALDNAPFTRVYVFYNKNINPGDPPVVYEIAGGLGGNNSLTIESPSTTLNVELRNGGVAGETMGYAPAGMLETTLKLEIGDYAIFPVFKRYNVTRDVLDTVYPLFPLDGTPLGGTPWFATRSFDGSSGTQKQVLDLSEILRNLTLTSGAAWVVVVNDTQDAIRFYEGSVPRITPSGLQGITSGTQNAVTFQVDMPTIPGSKNYADSVDVSNWGFGVPTRTTKLDPQTIERDKMYTITVTGSIAKGFVVNIDGGTAIDLTEFNL